MTITKLYPETTTQFLARMILATREGQQISSADAQRLSDHASYGIQVPTTMPEERRDPSKLPQQAGQKDVVAG